MWLVDHLQFAFGTKRREERDWTARLHTVYAGRRLLEFSLRFMKLAIIKQGICNVMYLIRAQRGLGILKFN